MEDDKVIGIILEIKSDVSEIKGKLNTYGDLQEKVSKNAEDIKDVDARSRSNTHQIKEIKDNLTWLWRTVVGALIAGAAGAWVVFK